MVSYPEQKTWLPIGEISWLGSSAEPAVALGQQGYKLHWGLETANLEQRLGDYTLPIWNGANYPTHLPSRGYYGTAT